MFIAISMGNVAVAQKNTKENSPDAIYGKAQEFAAMGNYAKSLEEFLKASRIYEVNKDHKNLAKTYNSIGLTYYELKNEVLSKSFYNKALAELSIVPDKRLLSYVYNNLGMLAGNQGVNDSAAYYYSESLQLKRKIRDSIGISRTLTNLGVIELKRQRFESALNYYVQSLRIKEKLHDTLGMATIYSNIADAYGWMGKLDSTEFYLTKGMQFARTKKDISTIKLFYSNFSALYNARGDFKKAFAYADSTIKIQEKLFTERMTREFVKQQIVYDTEKKEEQLKAERAKTKFLREKEKREKTEKNILIIFLVTALIVALLLYFIIRLRSKQIKQSAALLEKEKQLNLIVAQKAEQQQQMLEKEIELKTKELLSSSNLMLQKQEIILELKEQLVELKITDNSIPDDWFAKLSQTYASSLSIDQEWERFKTHFEHIHTSFFDRLNSLSSDLSETDLRHCAYIKIGMTTKEISSLLNLEPASVQKSRVRLKKKLALSRDEDLIEFIKKIV
ncbi:MAG: tetratricopeptide repeat protein [Flavobacteriia bacterium]|nr:tetratricopeptide repeat protein [Flavobacteriia bacterium]